MAPTIARLGNESTAAPQRTSPLRSQDSPLDPLPFVHASVEQVELTGSIKSSRSTDGPRTFFGVSFEFSVVDLAHHVEDGRDTSPGRKPGTSSSSLSIAPGSSGLQPWTLTRTTSSQQNFERVRELKPHVLLRDFAFEDLPELQEERGPPRRFLIPEVILEKDPVLVRGSGLGQEPRSRGREGGRRVKKARGGSPGRAAIPVCGTHPFDGQDASSMRLRGDQVNGAEVRPVFGEPPQPPLDPLRTVTSPHQAIHGEPLRRIARVGSRSCHLPLRTCPAITRDGGSWGVRRVGGAKASAWARRGSRGRAGSGTTDDHGDDQGGFIMANSWPMHWWDRRGTDTRRTGAGRRIVRG